MENLDQYQELTDIHFDNENPHYAICHVSQGKSANGCHDALMLKASDTKVTSELLKALSSVLPEDELVKMSAMNKRDLLEESIVERLRSNMSENGEYIYTHVMDYNEDLVVFRFQGQTWAVSYEETEAGLVEVADDIRSAHRKDLYIDSETGEELIKAADWFKKEIPSEPQITEVVGVEAGVDEGETLITPQNTLDTKEEIMSQENQTVEVAEIDFEKAMQSEAFQKAFEAQLEKAADKKAEEILKAKEAQELEKSTVEIMKGFTKFVAEEDAVELAKSVLASPSSDKLLSTLVKAAEAIEAAEEKVEEIKKEFGEKQDSVEATPVIQKTSNANLKELVAARKAAAKK